MRFDELPVHGCEHGVQVHRRELRPHVLHVLDAGEGRVAQFAAEDEKGLVVNDELGPVAHGLKVGDGLGEGCSAKKQKACAKT